MSLGDAVRAKEKTLSISRSTSFPLPSNLRLQQVKENPTDSEE
jgi:hypothetical protein